jgi:hypothetical protein
MEVSELLISVGARSRRAPNLLLTTHYFRVLHVIFLHLACVPTTKYHLLPHLPTAYLLIPACLQQGHAAHRGQSR